MPAALAVVPRGATERPAIRVMLPGRDEAFTVCHARMAWETCDGCLRAVAEFLAAESGYDLKAALDKTSESWRAELRDGLGFCCSTKRAHDLQLMTAAICYRRVRGDGSAAAMFVAALDAQMQVSPLRRKSAAPVEMTRCGQSAAPVEMTKSGQRDASVEMTRANRMPRWRRIAWAALVVWVAAIAVVVIWGRG